MRTTILAHFDGQYFVPDEPVIGLAPGDSVKVLPAPSPAQTASAVEQDSIFWQWLMDNPIEDDGLPADLGHQHDYYLYGTPKKPD